MRLFSKFRLSGALPLLALVCTVRGLPKVLVDPVTVDVQGAGPDVAGADLGGRLSSLRKEVVHMKTQFARNGSQDAAEVPAVGRHGRSHKAAHDTYVSLINATPYRWHLTYNNSYQLRDWDGMWPEYILPGASVTVRATNHGHGAGKISTDSAGEVTYEVEQTRRPASFQVQYRSGQPFQPGKPHDVRVQFRDQLQTLNNAVGAVVDLGFSRVPGGVGFVLAGREGDFVSNNGPVQWMQAQLPEIGRLPLREVLLPRSHNSGLWEGRHRLGAAQARNTLTQTQTLSHQLGPGGVRVVDMRPLLLDGRFYAVHGAVLLPPGSIMGAEFQGMAGASLADMIAEFNNFTASYPGELYIWDIHEESARSGDREFRPFDSFDVQRLYRELEAVQWRAALPDDHQDITRRPLDSFISPETKDKRQSSVIIRVPADWAKDGGFPGPKQGFVSADSFPLSSRWSNAHHLEDLVVDQTNYLNKMRPSRTSVMHNMDWVLTQSVLQVVFPVRSIIEMSRGSWRALYGSFWGALSDTTYPNMLSLDAVQGSSLKAIVMAVNKCFAARRCGSLGGKVKLPVQEGREGN
ncbi:hypothetical protein E4U53_006156 [Claviceps sorghi]|nr:hypothetical protein E4U53_006156 [Claviceps sorghi]